MYGHKIESNTQIFYYARRIPTASARLYQGANLRNGGSEGYLFLPLKMYCFRFFKLLSPTYKESERETITGVRRVVVVGIAVPVDIANVRRVVRGGRTEPPSRPGALTTNNLIFFFGGSNNLVRLFPFFN